MIICVYSTLINDISDFFLSKFFVIELKGYYQFRKNKIEIYAMLSMFFLFYHEDKCYNQISIYLHNIFYYNSHG